MEKQYEYFDFTNIQRVKIYFYFIIEINVNDILKRKKSPQHTPNFNILYLYIIKLQHTKKTFSFPCQH